MQNSKKVTPKTKGQLDTNLYQSRINVRQLKVIGKEFDFLDIGFWTVNYGNEKNCYTQFTAAIVWGNSCKATNFLKEIERQNGLGLEVFVKPILYFCFGGFLYVLYPHLKQKKFKRRGSGAEVYREVKDFISLFKTLGDRKIAFRTFCLENIFLVHGKIKLLRSQNLVYDSELDMSVLKKPNCYRMFDPLVFNPPELFEIGWCNSKCDIWTLGVYIFLLVTGRLPYGPNTYDFNLQMRESYMEPIPNDINPHLQTLITDMLRLDPTKRSTIAQVLASPWVLSQKAKSDHKTTLTRQAANINTQKTKSSWSWFNPLNPLKNLVDATHDTLTKAVQTVSRSASRTGNFLKRNLSEPLKKTVKMACLCYGDDNFEYRNMDGQSLLEQKRQNLKERLRVLERGKAKQRRELGMGRGAERGR